MAWVGAWWQSEVAADSGGVVVGNCFCRQKIDKRYGVLRERDLICVKE